MQILPTSVHLVLKVSGHFGHMAEPWLSYFGMGDVLVMS